MRSSVILSLFLVVAAACASGGRMEPARSADDTPVVYDRPNPALIRGYTEAGEGVGTHNIYVENGSDVPIVVTSVRLIECRNIRNACGPKRLRTRIRPHDSRLVLTVRSTGASTGWSYRYEYSWEVDQGS